MANKYLSLTALCLGALVGCEPDPNVAQINDTLRARQEKLQSVIQSYEAKRDTIREEITKLRAIKGGLEDPGTNTATVITVTNTPVITTQVVVVTNQIVSVTQQVSSFDMSGDGRVGDKLLMINHFKTSEVFCLPYSPHEFIVKSNGVVFYACKESSVGNSTNVYAFPIFKQ